jgi:hypothetical protein
MYIRRESGEKVPAITFPEALSFREGERMNRRFVRPSLYIHLQIQKGSRITTRSAGTK